MEGVFIYYLFQSLYDVCVCAQILMSASLEERSLPSTRKSTLVTLIAHVMIRTVVTTANVTLDEEVM
jgi:hypothetical protein